MKDGGNAGLVVVGVGAIIAAVAYYFKTQADTSPHESGATIGDTFTAKSPVSQVSSDLNDNLKSAIGDVTNAVANMFGETSNAAADLIARANTVVNGSTTYVRGAGDANPDSDSPGLTCDCSGFCCWLLRIKRGPKPYWISTTNIWKDATGKKQSFRVCDPKPGCFVVYPDNPKTGGHMALLVDPGKMRIIDCSESHNGIHEHDGTYFLRAPNMIYCEYIG